MDKPKVTQVNSSSTRSSTSLLSRLTHRRSTKVEPQNVTGEELRINGSQLPRQPDLPEQSVSAYSTPIKQYSSMRRHNSIQNIISEDNNCCGGSSSAAHTRNLKNNCQKSKNSSNRFSHQFSLCCTVDVKSATPPVSVRYNSVAKVAANHIDSNCHQQPPPLPPPNDAPKSLPNNHTITVHQIDEQVARRPLEVNVLVRTAAESKSLDDEQPVFGEYNSIAMTACRSRLRQKLLPPPRTNENAQQSIAEQHLSSPNISDRKTSDASNSRSLSYDMLTKRQVSANSLATQSLIAAQLLHLIPAEKARDRNFLAGRLAINSLFGAAELDRVLPLREVEIFVGTWNMNEQNPPKLMNEFVLPSGIDHIPDIVVIGTQESCSVRFEWEVSLQETLGPTHILLHSASLGTLHLAVFIRRDLIWFCSVPEDDSLSVRPGTAFRTKGAVAISFCLFGTTMLFVTSHLTAHQQKVKERVSDVKRIIHSLDLPKNLHMRNKNKDVTQNFDSVFWCGDLNFRLSEPREKVLKWIEETKFPLPSHLPNGYMHTDQLKSVLSNGAAFKDFKEANITFPPTYKYDPGTQQFDTSSKQRTPAYTDRILYKYKSLPTGLRRGSNLANLLHPSQVECLRYDSVPSIVTSDHKPVWALFKNPIRPGLDSVPLAAGLFNRDVYLEGMKRRLNNTKAGSSAVCCIQ